MRPTSQFYRGGVLGFAINVGFAIPRRHVFNAVIRLTCIGLPQLIFAGDFAAGEN